LRNKDQYEAVKATESKHMENAGWPLFVCCVAIKYIVHVQRQWELVVVRTVRQEQTKLFLERAYPKQINACSSRPFLNTLLLRYTHSRIIILIYCVRIPKSISFRSYTIHLGYQPRTGTQSP
jgi:hypothetical protein